MANEDRNMTLGMSLSLMCMTDIEKRRKESSRVPYVTGALLEFVLYTITASF